MQVLTPCMCAYEDANMKIRYNFAFLATPNNIMYSINQLKGISKINKPHKIKWPVKMVIKLA